MKWYVEVLKNYADFSDRARRKEYWMFVLINFFISFGIGIIDGRLGLAKLTGMKYIGPLGALYFLAVLIPSTAVAVRRLHDTNRSGWWLLLVLTIFGAIPLFIFFAQDSDPGQNKYGLNPKEWPL